MGSSKQKQKPKTKTFTGCWTCRSRKVKCDTTRPICTRCVRAGLACQGYDVRLHWVDDDDAVAPSAIKRQAMGLVLGNPHWPKSIDNIDERLHSLDQCQVEFGSETLLSGPFGLFGSQRHSSEHRARSLFESETEDSAAQPSLGESCAGQIFVYEAGSAQGSAEPSVVGQLNDGSSLSQISSPTWQSGEGVARINGESIEDEKDVENVPRSPELDVGFDTRSLIMHSNLGSTANRHNLISMLMNHYVLNVANILTPFRHPQNTYSSIYASSAMAVAQRIPQGSLSYDSPVSHSKVALVYSLLTSSAFQLRGRDDNTEADILARSFRNQAISHLQLALNSLSGPSPNGSPTNEIFAIAKREEVLSVMLTLITADILDGQMSEFWIHLDGAEQITQRLKDHVLPGSRGEHLLNVTLFLRIISQSTDSNMPSTPWEDTPQLGSLPHPFYGNGQGLEVTYGITATLSDYIRRTTRLAQNVSYYQSRATILPLGLQLACEKLLSDISLWDLAHETLRSLSDVDNITILLASKHILAFATSIRIYFHTRVTPCSPLEMESYVNVVAAHLSDIESIKKRTGYNEVLTATVTWPGFIASCEAEGSGREIWYEWWENMVQYPIGNIKSLWSVVKQTWKLKDQGCHQTPAWMSVLRQTGTRILVV